MSQPIVVVGGSGMLGQSLAAELTRRGLSHSRPGRDRLDLAAAGDPPVELLRSLGARAVINAAAYTDVNAAELPENRQAAYALNRDAPGRLARACAELKIPLVHVSTDYVFDGAKGEPYVEDDPTGPLQHYGRSKLEGEGEVLSACEQALVVRVSTLFGPGRSGRPHYVDAVLRQALDGKNLQIVRLPVSSPTYTPDLAHGLLELLQHDARGLVHLVNRGHCSRLELTRELVRQIGRAGEIEVSERAEGSGSLRRPAYSVLDTGRYTELTGEVPRRWQDALREYLGPLVT